MAINFIDGSMYTIEFGKTVGCEIDDFHYSILFNIKKNDEMVLCVPLTSPKQKHFKTEDGFKNRNHLDLKYPHTYYLKQTDSIALIDQIRVISVKRIREIYEMPNTGVQAVLNEVELNILKVRIQKFIKAVLYKK